MDDGYIQDFHRHHYFYHHHLPFDLYRSCYRYHQDQWLESKPKHPELNLPTHHPVPLPLHLLLLHHCNYHHHHQYYHHHHHHSLTMKVKRHHPPRPRTNRAGINVSIWLIPQPVPQNRLRSLDYRPFSILLLSMLSLLMMSCIVRHYRVCIQAGGGYIRDMHHERRRWHPVLNQGGDSPVGGFGLVLLMMLMMLTLMMKMMMMVMMMIMMMIIMMVRMVMRMMKMLKPETTKTRMMMMMVMMEMNTLRNEHYYYY